MRNVHLLLPVLLSAGLAAQNTNDDAPTASNSIAFGKTPELTVSYRSFTVAGGAWLARLYDAGEGGTQMRQFYNRQYITSYLRGSLKLAADVDLGGNPLQAGTYKLTFRIDEDLVWHLVVLDETGDQEICAVAMATERDDKHTADRLAIAPVAAAKGKEGHLRIHFGPLLAKVDFKIGKAAATKATQPAKRGQ